MVKLIMSGPFREPNKCQLSRESTSWVSVVESHHTVCNPLRHRCPFTVTLAAHNQGQFVVAVTPFIGVLAAIQHIFRISARIYLKVPVSPGSLPLYAGGPVRS